MTLTVILASASPRRIELIKKITDDFTVIPSAVDETVNENIAAEDIPVLLSQRKALDIAKGHPDDTVIGCDTVVISSGKVLGKPTDKDDARRMITELSGHGHTVITGVTIVHKGKAVSFPEITEVVFHTIYESDIEEYINTKEPYDKAGAYAVQGLAGKFVKELIGDYYNVVGFPVNRIRNTLKELGLAVKDEQ